MGQAKGTTRGRYHVQTDYIPAEGDAFRAYVAGGTYKNDVFGNDCTGMEIKCGIQIAIKPESNKTRDFVWTRIGILMASQFNFVKVKL